MASTQPIASESPSAPPFDLPGAWESSRGHVVRLLERTRLKGGVVLALACGEAPEAEQLTARGYEYVGVDVDREALAHAASRGFETHLLDVRAVDLLPARLLAIAGKRRVAAVVAHTGIERLGGTGDLFMALREVLDRLGRPPLIVSVPNIARLDVAAGLVFGRWDHSPVSFFTAARLAAETSAAGLLEVDAHDVVCPAGEEWLSIGAVDADAPAAELIRAWREAADPHGSTRHFVRTFVAADLDVERPEPASVGSGVVRPLTVVVRTQGTRSTSLRDALTCLAAQTVDTFDVLLMVHADDRELVASVRALADEFEPGLASRVTVVHVGKGGGRARPLNVALDQLRSDYVAFLDDDDLVTANWVESFCDRAGGGAIVRSGSARRWVGSAPKSAAAPYLIRSPLEFPFSVDFNLAEHLWQNQTPICAMAIPRSLVEMFTLRFDEQLSVLEDWDFLLRCALVASVRDTRQVTSVVQVWEEGESSRSLHSSELWISLERLLRERMNARPVALHAGAVRGVVETYQQRAELQLTLAETAAQVDYLRTRVEQLTGAYDHLEVRYQSVMQSKRWQLLDRPATAIQTLRRWRNRVAGR